MDKKKEKQNSDLQAILDGLARAARGDFSTKIKISSKDPGFVAITNSFNNMIKELRNTTDDVRDSQVELERITRKKLQMQL